MTKIPFNRPSVIGKEVSYLREAIRRGQLSGDGYFTNKCNSLIEEISGAKKALLTHSCTAALEMSAILCELKVGDEVIMPSFAFVSSANAVVLRGAVPVFVDIDSDTLNIDPQKLEEVITPKTRAIFVVHYAGFSADMDRLLEIACAHNLIVVEDAAHAVGSTYKGRKCGSLGDLATYSFHETKNIICGEGGALAINNPDMIDRAEIIREKGTNRSQFFRGQVDKYTWVDIGSSFLPGELAASYLCAQLEMASLINTRRQSIFDRYMEAFSDLAEGERVRSPRWLDECAGNGHMFYLLMKDLDDRTDFIGHMKEAGIITPFHYIPLHSSPAGRQYGHFSGTLSITDNTAERLVRLPIYFDLGSDVETVIDHALDYFSQNRGL